MITTYDDHMLRTGRAVAQLADQLSTEVPAVSEELQQLANEARRTFSRVEEAATAVTATLVVTTLVAVVALILATGAIVFIRREAI